MSVLLMIFLHVVHEQGMVSSGRNYSDFDSVFGVPVQELIIHKYLGKVTQVILLNNYDVDANSNIAQCKVSLYFNSGNIPSNIYHLKDSLATCHSYVSIA